MGPADEGQSIEVRRLPVVAIHLVLEALLVSSRVDHDCPTILDEFLSPFPQKSPNPRRKNSDEDSRTDLKQPPSQVPAQAGRASRDDEDYHGTSKSDASTSP